MNPLSGRLPRLLYISDVPVEASYHGSALLYRLLQDYPPEKLLIVERRPAFSLAERRLAGVEYRRLAAGLARFLNTRIHRYYTSIYLNLTPLDALLLWRSVHDFLPEAVLTVHHGYTWTAAASLARLQKLPLHLILHDDVKVSPARAQAALDRHTQSAYRQAASRQCVSPYMAEQYERRYGVRGTVLYPGRAKDAASFELPPERLQETPRRFTVAYGGNIFWKGYADALREVSLVLEPLGGRLLLFGPHRAENTEAWGLKRPNVEFRGLVSSADMIQAFRDEADCLFIPMSFAAEDRPNMEISFPSKLTDSTIPGVPLLIYGPPYSSAVRWARDNPGVAEVIDRCDPELLRFTLRGIMESAALRWKLGQSAIAAGREFFGFKTIRDAFFKGIIGSTT